MGSGEWGVDRKREREGEWGVGSGGGGVGVWGCGGGGWFILICIFVASEVSF